MNLLKWHTRLCIALGVLYVAVIVLAVASPGEGAWRFGE